MATVQGTGAPAPTRVEFESDRRLKRHVGVIGLLFVAIGGIIGSGWLFGALFAAELAGPASILSWVIGAIMILFIGLTYAELGTMFPMSGGVVRYPDFAWGSFASYTNGWITWIAVASVAPVEVEAALQYANNYLPFLQHLVGGVAVLTPIGFVVALVIMFAFCTINMVGIRFFARINNVAVWWKLAVITLVVVMLFVFGYHSGHMANPKFGGYAPLGFHGVFTAIATAGVVFSYFGFRQGVDLAGETDNPQRNVPISIIGSVIGCGILYVLLQIAFIGTMPDAALTHGWAHIGTDFKAGISDQVLAFGPMAGLASTLGFVWLMFVLYIDAFISPADTGLIYNMLTSRTSYAAARNRNFPPRLATVNKRGVPWRSVILSWFICSIFFLPFPGWQKLIGFVTSATVLAFGTGPLTLVCLRRELPDQERPFRLGGTALAWGVAFLAFLSSNLIVLWSGWDVDWKLMVVVLLGFLLLWYMQTRHGRDTPSLDFRYGWWMLVWLAGLTLLSWLSRYPDLSKHAGNVGVLDLVPLTIVTAIFSAFIMWLAFVTRLPARAVAEKIRRPWVDAEAPEAGSAAVAEPEASSTPASD
ncbi:MAG TPA: APC family permease [Nevskiaceae bacterium]